MEKMGDNSDNDSINNDYDEEIQMALLASAKSRFTRIGSRETSPPTQNKRFRGEDCQSDETPRARSSSQEPSSGCAREAISGSSRVQSPVPGSSRDYVPQPLDFSLYSSRYLEYGRRRCPLPFSRVPPLQPISLPRVAPIPRALGLMPRIQCRHSSCVSRRRQIYSTLNLFRKIARILNEYSAGAKPKEGDMLRNKNIQTGSETDNYEDTETPELYPEDVSLESFEYICSYLVDRLSYFLRIYEKIEIKHCNERFKQLKLQENAATQTDFDEPSSEVGEPKPLEGDFNPKVVASEPQTNNDELKDFLLNIFTEVIYELRNTVIEVEHKLHTCDVLNCLETEPSQPSTSASNIPQTYGGKYIPSFVVQHPTNVVGDQKRIDATEGSSTVARVTQSLKKICYSPIEIINLDDSSSNSDVDIVNPDNKLQVIEVDSESGDNQNGKGTERVENEEEGELNKNINERLRRENENRMEDNAELIQKEENERQGNQNGNENENRIENGNPDNIRVEVHDQYVNDRDADDRDADDRDADDRDADDRDADDRDADDRDADDRDANDRDVNDQDIEPDVNGGGWHM